MASRNLLKLVPILRAPVRGRSLWTPDFWRPRSSSVPDWFDRFDHEIDRMRKEFGRLWDVSAVLPSRFFRHPAHLDELYLNQPIVEENGVKKYKLVFDVSHFKPEEITVKTKDHRLSIEAKHVSKDKHHQSQYHFMREFQLPEGVKPEELTCKYTSDGSMELEAPFHGQAIEAPKETPIPIKNES